MVREQNPNGISSSVSYLEHCLDSFVGPQNHHLHIDSHTRLIEWSLTVMRLKKSQSIGSIAWYALLF